MSRGLRREHEGLKREKRRGFARRKKRDSVYRRKESNFVERKSKESRQSNIEGQRRLRMRHAKRKLQPPSGFKQLAEGHLYDGS